MRPLEIAIVAIIGLFAATAQAADSSSPIVGTLPDPATPQMKQTLFTLKKNDILLSMSGEEFCKKLDYGDAVLSYREEIVKDHAVVQGPLSWVICKYNGK